MACRDTGKVLVNDIASLSLGGPAIFLSLHFISPQRKKQRELFWICQEKETRPSMFYFNSVDLTIGLFM